MEQVARHRPMGYRAACHGVELTGGLCGSPLSIRPRLCC